MVEAGDRVVCLHPLEAVGAGGIVKKIIPGVAAGGEDAVVLEGWTDSWLWPASWFVVAS